MANKPSNADIALIALCFAIIAMMLIGGVVGTLYRLWHWLRLYI